MLFFKKGIHWKLILLFGIPGILLAFLASRLPTTIPELQLKRILGVFLITYTLFLLTKPEWKLKQTSFNAVLGGSLSGFFAGIFGVGGAVRGAFLSNFNLKKSVYIFTSGVIGFLIDSSRLTGYVTDGIRLSRLKPLTLFVAVLISFLGAYLARLTVDKIPQKKFRFVVALALLLVGVRYLIF